MQCHTFGPFILLLMSCHSRSETLMVLFNVQFKNNLEKFKNEYQNIIIGPVTTGNFQRKYSPVLTIPIGKTT